MATIKHKFTSNAADGTRNDLLQPSNWNATHELTGVTEAELGHLSGVTSAIQGQFNAKAPLDSPTFTGDVELPATTTVGGLSLTANSFDAGISGFTATITPAFNFSKAGNIVTLGIPSFTGTSNAATMYFIIPIAWVELYPYSTTSVPCAITVGGVKSIGVCEITDGGYVQFKLVPTANFPTTGQKGIDACSITYSTY